MEQLAKIGFSQSYTYFTWRQTGAELREYFTELTDPHGRLHAAQRVAQHARHPHRAAPARRPAGVRHPGGPRRHAVRRAGASTARRSSSSSTRRSGPAARSTSTARSTSCGRGTSTSRTRSRPCIARLNEIRRATPRCSTSAGCGSTAPTTTSCSCYSKMSTRPATTGVLVVVNLDPTIAQAGLGRRRPAPRLDLPYESRRYLLDDELGGGTYRWTGPHQLGRARPGRPGGPRLRRRRRADRDRRPA